MEPDPHRGPLRRFKDPAYVPLAGKLDDIRQHIDRIDAEIVALMAERARYVKDAARFKADTQQVAAPARQAEVFARARELALRSDARLEGFDEIVEATFRTMVAAYIERQARCYADTEPLE